LQRVASSSILERSIFFVFSCLAKTGGGRIHPSEDQSVSLSLPAPAGIIFDLPFFASVCNWIPKLKSSAVRQVAQAGSIPFDCQKDAGNKLR
jgi:hypothetical protein